MGCNGTRSSEIDAGEVVAGEVYEPGRALATESDVVARHSHRSLERMGCEATDVAGDTPLLPGGCVSPDLDVVRRR